MRSWFQYSNMVSISKKNGKMLLDQIHRNVHFDCTFGSALYADGILARESVGVKQRSPRQDSEHPLLCHFCSTHNFPSEPNCFCASILDAKQEDQAERSSQMNNGNCPVSRTTKSQVDNITTRLDDHLTSPGATPTFLALAWTPFTAAALINCASPSKQTVEEMKGIYIGKS